MDEEVQGLLSAREAQVPRPPLAQAICNRTGQLAVACALVVLVPSLWMACLGLKGHHSAGKQPPSEQLFLDRKWDESASSGQGRVAYDSSDSWGDSEDDRGSQLADDWQDSDVTTTNEIEAAGAHAANEAMLGGKSAADAAAAAGDAAAEAAEIYGYGKEEIEEAASAAAHAAGLAAGMPAAAAQAAGELAAKVLEPTAPPPPVVIYPPPMTCRTVSPAGEPKCWQEIMWIKQHGLVEHEDWYPGLDASSPTEDLQKAALKNTKGHCKLEPCAVGQIECLPENGGCVGDAVTEANTWLGQQAAGGACKVPQVEVSGHCVCPPNMVLDSVQGCKPATERQKMTFYMYRAQSDAIYGMENVNMADVAGVLWYLHREVVQSIPRKYNVTRILRYLVTVKNTEEAFSHNAAIYGDSVQVGKQFGPFVAYDNAQCTATDCTTTFEEFGYSVGCQGIDDSDYNYQRLHAAPLCEPPDRPSCTSGTWFSLPGSCPQEPLSAKTDSCRRQTPGGACANPDGSSGCTFKATFAGQISLDDLVGIPNYETWWKNETGPTGNIEYNVLSDSGNGTTWWNDRNDRESAKQRQEAVIKLFGDKYSMLPADLPTPACS